MVLRLFMLTVHYRTPINYTLENIELAKTNYEKIKTSYQNLQFRLNNDMSDEKTRYRSCSISYRRVKQI